MKNLNMAQLWVIETALEVLSLHSDMAGVEETKEIIFEMKSDLFKKQLEETVENTQEQIVIQDKFKNMRDYAHMIMSSQKRLKEIYDDQQKHLSNLLEMYEESPIKKSKPLSN